MAKRYIDAERIDFSPLIDDFDRARAKVIIMGQPTADVVEVKHGEWAVNVGMNFNKERICPICKKKIEGNYWNYCSNCGAIMDGGKRDE